MHDNSKQLPKIVFNIGYLLKCNSVYYVFLRVVRAISTVHPYLVTLILSVIYIKIEN